MNYEIRTAQQLVDVVHLGQVIHAMADKGARTDGKRPFSDTVYQFRHREISAWLRRAALTGKLTVCNQMGEVFAADYLIKEATRESKPNIVFEEDIQNDLRGLYTRVAHLNQWGCDAGGDTFSIHDEPMAWIEKIKGCRTVNGLPATLRVVARRGRESDYALEWHEPSSAVMDGLVGTSVVPKLVQQKDAILAFLNGQGIDPKKMPVPKKGMPGHKALVRSHLLKNRKLFSESSFGKAWDLLRSDREIVDAI